MAVRIRLRRMGAKRQPFFRVVVADSRSPRDGRFLDTIGTYDPRAEPARIDINREKALRWLENGALPTDSARSLLSKTGIWQRFRTGADPADAGETPVERSAEATAEEE
ncbi:MAG: 30S ribosomal protein S16 [Gemmatimonadetes bacterium]|jgi:small subunit ribosomal protein S16|nr:30S ribosomal protein S16 [Gemmatimonadota bacterium]